MAQTTQQVGDILANAPIAVPTNFLQIADGILCRCDSNANNIAGNDIVTFTATITLATAPAIGILDSIAYEYRNGQDMTKQLSEQYIINTLTNDSIVAKILADLRALFGSYLVGAGDVAVVKNPTTLVVTVKARAPFAPLALLVNGVAVNFV